MVKNYIDLDNQSKNRLSDMVYKLNVNNIYVSDALLMNEQQWYNANLSDKLLKYKKKNSTLDGYKRLLRQLTSIPDRFNNSVNLSVQRKYILKGNFQIEVIQAYINASYRLFNKPKNIQFNTVYHDFISETVYKTSDNKNRLKYLLEFKQQPNRLDNFLNSSAIINNWFWQIRDYITTDLIILFQDLSYYLQLIYPKYIGISLTFETYDAKTNHYILSNHSGFHTRLLFNPRSLLNDIDNKMRNLDDYFSGLANSVQYYIHISDIHFVFQY